MINQSNLHSIFASIRFQNFQICFKSFKLYEHKNDIIFDISDKLFWVRKYDVFANFENSKDKKTNQM